MVFFFEYPKLGGERSLQVWQSAGRKGGEILHKLHIALCKSPLCFGKEPFSIFLLIDNSEKDT